MIRDYPQLTRNSGNLQWHFRGTRGPAGTTSNIPGYVAANNAQSQYEKKEATKNYE